MANGRTVWWGKDAGWWRRERIVELGEEFGAEGPAVIDWLTCEAKAQNDRGRVKAGRRSVSRGCFVDVVTVGRVLSRCVTLGLLEDFEDARGLFACRISGWSADQERALSAARKARQRLIDPGDQPPLSRFVPKCPPTGEDRTGEERTEDTSSLRSEVARKRATRRVDQSKLPADFPPELVAMVDVVQPILSGVWDLRGGIEPGRHGIGLALLRSPRADHEQVARQLEHWMLAGKGQRAPCRDVVRRFSDWLVGEPAQQRGGVVVSLQRDAVARANAWQDSGIHA